MWSAVKSGLLRVVPRLPRASHLSTTAARGPRPTPKARRPFKASSNKGGGRSPLRGELSGASRADQVLEALSRARAAKTKLDPITVSIAIHRLGKFRANPGDERVAWLLKTALPSFASIDAQGVSTSAWGLTKLQVRDEAIWKAISINAQRLKGDFVPQTIANLMWSLATLDITPSADLVVAMSGEAVAKRKDFKAQNIANLL